MKWRYKVQPIVVMLANQHVVSEGAAVVRAGDSVRGWLVSGSAGWAGGWGSLSGAGSWFSQHFVFPVTHQLCESSSASVGRCVMTGDCFFIRKLLP